MDARPFFAQRSVKIFHALYSLMHIMLVIQLAFLSGFHDHNVHWFVFGWFLEAFFVFYMVINLISSGVRRYLSFYDNLLDMAINFSVFVILIVLGSDYLHNGYRPHMSTSMCCYLLASLFRLFKLFFLVNDVELFEHILPVLLRASFILYSVIYFFAIFGYSYFCDALNANEVTSNDDDDAGQWLAYENMLNFKSNLQSLFTLFEMSVLGNWSIVMDAAAMSSNPYSAYIFFYTFRLIITLMVLPLLLSFILQAFLSALNKKAKSAYLLEQQENKNQEKSSDSNVVANQNGYNSDTTGDNQDDQVVKEETVCMSMLNYVDDEEDESTTESGSESDVFKVETRPAVSNLRSSFNISRSTGVDDDVVDDDETANPVHTPAAYDRSVGLGSGKRDSSIASRPSSMPNRNNRSTVSQHGMHISNPDNINSQTSMPIATATDSNGGKGAKSRQRQSVMALPSIQFGVDRSDLGKVKGVNVESINSSNSKKNDTRNGGDSLGTTTTNKNVSSANIKSNNNVNRDITVQYDNNSSSMVSIWAQDNVSPHSPTVSRTPKSDGSTKVKSMNGGNDSPINNSSNNNQSETIAKLQKQLDDALQELQREKMRNSGN